VSTKKNFSDLFQNAKFDLFGTLKSQLATLTDSHAVFKAHQHPQLQGPLELARNVPQTISKPV